MEKTYVDALTVALSNSGADASTLAGWAENIRHADAALDGPIAALVREGEANAAVELAERGAAIQACAAFLDRLYEEIETPREG